MPLPKIISPIFSLTIPSTGKQLKYRPFLAKEEKILLISKESDDKKDILNALKQVISNCIEETFNIDTLTMFDLEYVFLKIRSKSVSNIVKLSYKDNEDNKTYDFEVDLDLVDIKKDPSHTNKIKINDDISLLMRYMTINETQEMMASSAPDEANFAVIIKSIEAVYDKENVYDLKEYSKEEVDEFLDSFSMKNLEDIRQFFVTMPKMYHKLSYTTSKGTERVIELTTLSDFFTF